jgi:hypothetical protein
MSTTQFDHQTVAAIYELTSSSANLSIADNSQEVLDLDNEIIDTHNAVTTGASWKFTAPKTGRYQVTVLPLFWSNDTDLSDANIYLRKGGTPVARLSTIDGAFDRMPSGAYTIILTQNEYIDLTGYQNDTSSGARTIAAGAAGTEYNFRVIIKSDPNFSNTGVYGKYEVIESYGTGAAWPFGAGVTGNLTSIEIYPGTWTISAYLGVRNSGGLGAVSDITLAISQVSADTTGLSAGEDTAFMSQISDIYFAQANSIIGKEITVTETTTLYLVANSGVQTNLGYTGYKIRAERKK